MANSKRAFTLHSPHGSRGLYFCWQQGSGNYLATTGANQIVSLYDRHGDLQDQIRLPGLCTGLGWDKDGDLLAAVTDKSPVLLLWDAHTQKTLQLDTSLRDSLSLLVWGRTGPLLAVGTFKGNLLIYNHKSSRKVTVMSKHNRKITCGSWSQQNLLALGSEDKTLSISSLEGDTLRIATLRAEPSDIRFSEMKQDERILGENTVSVVIGKKTLYLFNLNDPDNPIELAFQQKYGSIISYEWFGDGYILIGFGGGFLVVLSTHLKEIGQELFQVKNYRDSLTGLAISFSLGKIGSCGDNSIKIHELNDLKDTADVITLDEERGLERLAWSEDGQLLAVGTSSGNLHVFLTKLPIIGDVYGTRLAFLTTLLEVTVHNPIEKDMPILLTAEVEPAFLALGPFQLALGMNNRAWFYSLGDTSAELLCDREYLGTVQSMKLNGDYASVLYEKKIQLHAIEQDLGQSEERETRIFPDQDAPNLLITCHALTPEFLIYGSEDGKIFYFFLEDWKQIIEFTHTAGIRNIYPEVVGVKVVVVDEKAEGYVYNPVADHMAKIENFPPKAKGVLWENWLSDRNVFAVFDDENIYTYVYCIESTDGVGTTVERTGLSKIALGQVPLLLHNGEVTMQTAGGRLATLVLSSHELAPKTDENQDVELRKGLAKNLALRRFRDAWAVCQVLNKKEDWENMAKAAMKNLEVELAINCYRQIGDVGMVWSLKTIEGVEDKMLLAGHMAINLGDYDKAQEFFLKSSDPLAALDLWQDCLQWDQALQLAKRLAPDRVPFISREYAQQLEFTADYPNALSLYQQGLAEDGEMSAQQEEQNRICYAGIARMSLRCGDIRKGVAIALEQSNRTLKKECAEILETMRQYAEAAMLYEKAQYFDKAASMYIILKNWHKVGEILPNVSAPKIHIQYAKAKEQEGYYREAVKAYESARDYDSIIRINLDHLKNPDDAVRIVKETRSVEGAKMVARFFQQLKDFASAIRFLVMSQCNDEAFQLAQEHGQMELYAEVIGKDASLQDYLNIATYFQEKKHHLMAGKFFHLAGEYSKALHHLLRLAQSNTEDSLSEAMNLAVDVVGAANNEQLSRQLIQFLLGETDGVPKDAKYLFRLYMSLKLYKEAGKTAIIIATEEQNAGNYRNAHDVLFVMYQELMKQKIHIPAEMQNNLMLLHSYILVKVHIRRQDHLKAARLLIRVANSISKFPSHVVSIMTSTVIECQRSGLRGPAFNFAATLLRPEYRDKIDERYRKKIEAVVRKSSRPSGSNRDMEQDEPSTPCPWCSHLVPEMELCCPNCKNTLQFCIITGRHIIEDDLTACPNCNFPAIRSEFLSLVQSGEVCPMCSKPVVADALKGITDLKPYLHGPDEE